MPFPHTCCCNCFIYCIVFFGGEGVLFRRGGKSKGFVCFFNSDFSPMSHANLTSEILYFDPDVGVSFPISGLLCMQVHKLANRWNSGLPLNFNVKGMLQASGSMGVWCWEGTRICLCMSVWPDEIAVSGWVWRKRGEMNLSIDVHHLLCSTVSCFTYCVCVMNVTRLLLVWMLHRYLVSEFLEHSCWESVCVCCSEHRHNSLFSCSENEELTKCYFMFLFVLGFVFFPLFSRLFVTLLFPCLRVNHSWEQNSWIKEMIKKRNGGRETFCLLV